MQPNPNRPSRQRVERGIVKRTTADGRTVFEIEYRDSAGRQRRRAVAGGIRAARVALADVKARMGRGERVSPQPRLTFGQAAERYMESASERSRASSSRRRSRRRRAASQACARRAVSS